MRVFISWSGNQSRRLGEAFRDWLPAVLQLVKPYFTPSDVEKGTRWATEIAKELENAEIGVLCVTRENLHSEWIMFEAGALSKRLEKAFVCPILFGITNTDLAGPLKQFQTTEFNKNDMQKLLSVINSRLGEHKLPTKTLDNVFEKWWPELEQQISTILKEENDKNKEPVRSERDLLVEILELSRAASKQQLQMAPRLSTNALIELYDLFVDLHKDQASGYGGYLETLESMKKLRAALTHIGERYSGLNSTLDESFRQFRTLDYQLNPTGRAVEANEDIPF